MWTCGKAPGAIALVALLALTACPPADEPREDDPAVEAPVPAPAVPEEEPWMHPDSPAMEPIFDPDEDEEDRDA